ncbi:hypothetical protein KFK09_026220 [Dendrobium nobile]|uniref:Uncharacterized protein n=1 Tax=Dendrobium nobile TaxID=94219 RepID=A0A8T3A646_DENNO|nr:hypothetical protein KFK09_026220 [Dendrobium nobile]
MRSLLHIPPPNSVLATSPGCGFLSLPLGSFEFTHRAPQPREVSRFLVCCLPNAGAQKNSLTRSLYGSRSIASPIPTPHTRKEARSIVIPVRWTSRTSLNAGKLPSSSKMPP